MSIGITEVMIVFKQVSQTFQPLMLLVKLTYNHTPKLMPLVETVAGLAGMFKRTDNCFENTPLS